jgi:hypothetical protein
VPAVSDVVTVIIALVVISILMVLAVVIGTRVALGRKNRVVTDVPSPTPISWLTSSRREAKLHRRLRSAGRRLELVPATEGITDVLTRLRIELVELDSHLVTVSRRPTPARRADRREVADRITEVEDLVRRVEERSRNQPGSLTELTERLDLLEAADEELRGLEPG